MGAHEYELLDPPTEPRARELWLQHAAGFIFFEDVRRYATERIDPALPEEAKAAVQKGIDDAVYGLMMVIEGVSGWLSNTEHRVMIDFIARLVERTELREEPVLSEIDLRKGDGMCMGYHGWIKGDFGRDPVAVPKSNEKKPGKKKSAKKKKS